MLNKDPKRLKRVPIKEELVEITGDFIKAIILQQFLYWSERTKDYDNFINEERERAEQRGEECSTNPTNGWIYKSSEELSEETMMGYKATAIREHIKKIVAKGYLSERRNPDDKRDRTLQYRINLLAIQLDLLEKGYHLEGYKNPFASEDLLKVIQNQSDSRNPKIPTSLNEFAFSESENANSESENAQPCEFDGLSNNQANSESENANSEYDVANSKSNVANREIIEALPETTSETTPERDTYLIINDPWKTVVDNFRDSLSAQSFASWILPIKSVLQDTRLILTCSNKFSATWVKERYLEIIIAALSQKGLSELVIKSVDDNNPVIIKLE